MYDVPEFVFHEGYLERLRTPETWSRLDAALARGREYGAMEAAEYALASEPGPPPLVEPVETPEQQPLVEPVETPAPVISTSSISV